MSATCRQRTGRCCPMRISRCRGRSTANPRSTSKTIAQAMRGADGLFLATDPDREGEAISWHVQEVLKIAPRAEGCRRQARRVQRGDPQRRGRGVPPPARDRPRAGRCLSRAPRARLSGRLHPVAGAVAQIAGQPLGRPRAVGGAAPHLRARSRDRGVQAARILDRRGRVRDRARAELHRAADPSRRQAPRPLRPRQRGQGARRGRRDPRRRGLCRRRDRAPAGPPQPVPAVHHLDLAAGGLAQARLRRQPHDAARPAALRGRRSRRRDGRAHHLYAHRRRRDLGRGDRRGARADRQRFRRALRARRAARLPQPGEERAGGARGDPADRPRRASRPMSPPISTATSAGSTS